ncbi:MAG TPA: NADH-quinone oxidoreductase subunit C [bacterium]|nr:NADH-quinone oxidoreductase subunit C [bacterium]
MDRSDRTDAFLQACGNKLSDVIRKRKRLYFVVRDEDLREIVRYLFLDMGCRLSTATATEVYDAIEVLYQFSHDPSGCYFCPRVRMTDKENPVMHSITPVVPGAEWIEREMFDFWGVTFRDHPRPERLLAKDHPNHLDKPLRFGRVS